MVTLNENNMQQQVNIDLKKTLPIVCEECNNQTFSEALILRKVSKFVTATEKDSIYPIPTFVCTKCGHVNSDFMPKLTNNEE